MKSGIFQVVDIEKVNYAQRHSLMRKTVRKNVLDLFRVVEFATRPPVALRKR